MQAMKAIPAMSNMKIEKKSDTGAQGKIGRADLFPTSRHAGTLPTAHFESERSVHCLGAH